MPQMTGRLTSLAASFVTVSAVLAIGLTLPASSNSLDNKRELVHAWTRMDFAFRTDAERKSYFDDKVYAKAALAGVDVARDGTVFVTVPRWLDGRVPSTLNKVVKRDGKSVLEPWPSWEANALATSGGLRNVLGAAIDRKNRLWALDMGNVAGEDSVPDGAMKLVIFDIATGREVKRHSFADGVIDRKTTFLNDLVIDEARGIAYISDSGVRGGSPTPSGIIIYDFKTNTSRRVLDKHPSVQDDKTRPLTVNGEAVFNDNPLSVGINGLALSRNGSVLHWVVTTGDGLYKVPTAALLGTDATAMAKAVQGPIRLGGGADGMAVDRQGQIVVTSLADNAIKRVDPASGKVTTLASGTDMIWPDSLALDRQGDVWFTSNHLNHVFGGVMSFDKSEPNFRMWRLRNTAR
jgi:sugar lactone lactonase YvrE